MWRRGGLWVVATATAGIGFVVPVASSAAEVPRVPIYNPSTASYLRIEPAVITFTGDDSGYLAGRGHASHHPKRGRLHWREWSRQKATGTGAEWGDNCLPSCATGLRTPSPVRVTLYRPRREGGYKIFTRMRTTYTEARPPHRHRRLYVTRVVYRQPAFSWVGGLLG
jgi:hypothetical protein